MEGNKESADYERSFEVAAYIVGCLVLEGVIEIDIDQPGDLSVSARGEYEKIETGTRIIARVLQGRLGEFVGLPFRW